MAWLAPSGFHGRFKGQNGTPRLGEEEVPPSTHTQFLILALTSETGSRLPQYIRLLPHRHMPPSLSSTLMFSQSSHPHQLSPSQGWKGVLLGRVGIVSLHTPQEQTCTDPGTCLEWVPWGEGPGWGGEAGWGRNRVAELWSLKPQAVSTVDSLRSPSEQGWDSNPASKSTSLRASLRSLTSHSG